MTSGGFVSRVEPFSRGRSICTMPITIGGVPKLQLLEQVKAVRYVSPYAERIIKHPHREWHSLSEEEQATKSKKNYDIFRARWHHGESLLVANYRQENLWRIPPTNVTYSGS